MTYTSAKGARIGVLLTEDQADQLKYYAARAGLRTGDAIVAAVKDWLEQQSKGSRS